MMEKGNLIVNSGGYRVLNSYMVLGVTIKREISSLFSVLDDSAELTM